MGRDAAMTVTAPLRNYVNRQFEKMDESWQSRMHLVQHRLLGDIEAASELTSTHARSLTLLNQRLDQLNERLDQLDARLSQLPDAVAAAIQDHPGGVGTGARRPRAPRET
jgi:chromosome segregation ATPase